MIFGIAVLGFFSCGLSVILILTCGIAVSSSSAVCGFSLFWLTVFGEIRCSRHYRTVYLRFPFDTFSLFPIVETRADKGWAVKRARPNKKV